MERKLRVEYAGALSPVSGSHKSEPNGPSAAVVHSAVAVNQALERLHFKESIIESAESAIAACDLEGRMTYANRNFFTVWGFESQAEVVGRHFPEFWMVEDRVDAIIAVLLDAGIWSDDIQARRRDGTLFDVHVTASSVFDSKGKRIGFMSTTTNITARKQAEKALRESEEIMRSIYRVAPTGIGVIADSVLREVNPRICAMTGYSREELLSKNARMLYPSQEEYEFAVQENYGYAEREGSGELETRWRKKDGTVINVLLACTFIDQKDHAKGITFTALDITERKRVEHLLSSSEVMLASSQRLASVGGWEWDVDRQTMTWTDETYRIHGMTPGEPAAGSPEHIVRSLRCYDPADRPVIEAAFRDCIAHGHSYDLDFPLTRIDGGRIWIRTQAQAVQEGHRVVKIIGTIMDITARKQAERQLVEKQTYLDFILNATNTHLNISDSAFNLVYVDAAWQKIYGEPNGRKCYDYFMGRAEPCSTCGFPKAQQTHEIVVAEEFLPKENRYFEVHTIPFQNEQGQWLCAEFNIDITARKLAEKSILEAERLSAIGELAAGVSHDFNNALQAILGNLELALLDQVPPETRKFIETAKKSAQDAASRVSLLQRFAINKTGQAEHEPISIKDIIEDSIAQTRTLWKDDAQKEGLTFDIRTDCQESVTVRGNRGDLRSVLYNIIKNSIQAMPQGGTVEIRTRSDGKKAYLSIADTGMGMDEETAKKIFQPFFTTKGFEQGKGLGMSGVFTIIKEHRGDICVKRTLPGHGTEIELTLPCCEPETVREVKRKEYSGVARVLLVDDEAMIREIMQELVANMGHQIDVASSGREALDFLATGRYDLLITDIGMPYMSGWQLAEQIKGVYPDMKVAVVTGWGDSVDAAQKTHHGVGYVLGKPVGREQLKNLIGEVLQMKTSKA